MGKRKDRRQAAMLATGRRVKLDLFADPSGDSSIKEEIGGNDMNSDEQTEIRNSPSSSGKKANPLLLLGQYSDEESDEEELERSSDAKMEESVQNGQVEDNTADSNKTEKQSPKITEPVISDIYEDQNENSTKRALITQNPVTQTSETQIPTNFGDWKTLIHEETNQYYFWNTVTGETSWELPAGAVPVPVQEVPIDGTVSVETGTETTEESSVPAERQVAESGEERDLNGGAVLKPEFGEERESNGGTVLKADFDPEQLVRFGEDLVSRLAPLEGSIDEIRPLRKEIEVRIEDCKALLLYGSSILPFWIHTETKLKLLEASILEAEETFSLTKTHDSREERETEPPKEEENDNNINNMFSTEYSEKEKIEEKEKDEPKIETETDMDVEMEVEEAETSKTETNPNHNNTIIISDNTEKTNLPLLEEGEIPSPPSDEWAPPPLPPGTEPVPPPPGTEPVPPPPGTVPVPNPVHVPVPLPPGIEPVPPPPPAGEEPVPPPPPPEEEPVPISEPVPAQLSASYASYVEPVPVQVPVQSYVGLPTYDFGASYQTYAQPNYYESMAYYTVPAVPTTVPVPVPAQIAVPVPTPVPVPVPSETGTEVERSVQTDSTAGSKVQNTKVVKGKKRTSAVLTTMRSNKKVASLVNKWKAASEEIHEEPESSIEALEKKRQREIEEWKANQIASGEAQDNANFVPLGGDWRERVKRRRAKEAKKEQKSENSSETENINISSSLQDKKLEKKSVQEKQENHDLAKFSVGLPSNWHAYWDESSKQVYYGNIVTSETTWVKPTK